MYFNICHNKINAEIVYEFIILSVRFLIKT